MERDVHKAESCRGAGIASLKLGDYEEAADYFEQALSQKGLDKGFRKDVLSYQATAQYKNGQYEDAKKPVKACWNCLRTLRVAIWQEE